MNLTTDEKDTISRWRFEIRSARMSIRLLNDKKKRLKERPIRSRDPIGELEIISKISEYRSIIRDRERAILAKKQAQQ